MAQGLHDLHNPPKSSVYPETDGVYRHQEFPKLVYKAPTKGQHANEAHKLVNDKDELAAALKAGYKSRPHVAEPEEVDAGAGAVEGGDSISPATAPSVPKTRGKNKKAAEPKAEE